MAKQKSDGQFVNKETGVSYTVGASFPKATEKYCAHGVALFGVPTPECVECEIVWYQANLADAAKRVMSCSEQINKLLAKRRSKP